jgi:ABC-type multidrug transport system fused ATPase/permease subunit
MELFFAFITLLAALVTALVYGLGGTLVIHGVFQVGTLVAFIALVSQLYGPLDTVSRLPLEILTALVSFDRVFEILDLKPLITEGPTAYPLTQTREAPGVEVAGVWFRYPEADQVSVASLESVAQRTPERPGDAWVLRDVTFQVPRIWELISSLPDGLDTVAGDRGYRFSRGEKQRVALARLLLKAPSVVVLDEATAHLDSESEVAIQRALATALAGRTSLVIAHRLSTVRDADVILVIDNGSIVERGTHDQLLARGGAYADLYRTQFSKDPHGAREEVPLRSAAVLT